MNILVAAATAWLLAVNATGSFQPAVAVPTERVETKSPGALALAAASLPYGDPASLPGKGVLTPADEVFLEDLQRRGIQFYIEEADPETGLMPDRSRAIGGASNDVASTASVGFGLTALCIAEKNGWIEKFEAYDRAMRVLRFLRDKAPQERGHFYHFLDMHTGERQWECEVSNVDTALLMWGVLVVRQHFPGTELAKLADELYERVEWTWLLDEKTGLLHHGWKPETGMLQATWGGYSEGPPLILLLGMGSKTHPLPASVWKAWKREPVVTYAGLTFVQCPPLFTHQFPQCWVDLRGMNDGTMDYFRNAQLATIAMRQWTIDELAKRFPTYNKNIWGLTASDYQGGYTAWGGPPQQGDIDGTVVPCAAAGSIGFEPRITVDALKAMREQYGEKGYLKYGFVDAFNPGKNWYNRDVIGIDVGPGVLMAENARTGWVWKTVMSCPEIQTALKAAGFEKNAVVDEGRATSSLVSNVKEVRPEAP